MKIKDYRCKCGHNEFFLADKGNQIGIYCSYCGKWLKWADKGEQNLTIKREPILDKIRAEIEKVYKQEEPIEHNWAMGLKYSLKIIDRYKAGEANENNNR